MRNVLRSLVPPALWALASRLKERVFPPKDHLAEYLKRPVPWSIGYHYHKAGYLSAQLGRIDILDCFAGGGRLPDGFGIGLDERCVEYPWAIARLRGSAGNLLDAGSVFNFDYILNCPSLEPFKITIVNLHPETNCYHGRAVNYLYEDLRSLPLADKWFEQIVCISTLEHIGFDNELFSSQFEAGSPSGPLASNFSDADYKQALLELWRVLKPGGVLLLSVPFGVREVSSTQQVFDLTELNALLAVLPDAAKRVDFFRYRGEGWQLSDADDCKDAQYVDWVTLPRDAKPKDFPVQPDGASASRAVACIEMRKSERKI